MKRFEKFSPNVRLTPELVDAYVRRGNRLRSQAVHGALAGLAGALRRLLARRPRRARARAA